MTPIKRSSLIISLILLIVDQVKVMSAANLPTQSLRRIENLEPNRKQSMQQTQESNVDIIGLIQSADDESNSIESDSLDSNRLSFRPAEPQVTKLESNNRNVDVSSKWHKRLQEQLIHETLRHRVAEKDHLIMEKWLVDNINDLHRELKQTETDFEHYFQVTKNIIAQNERQFKQQVASLMTIAGALPFQMPLMNNMVAPIELNDKKRVGSLRTLLLASGHNWT